MIRARVRTDEMRGEFRPECSKCCQSDRVINALSPSSSVMLKLLLVVLYFWL